MSAVVKTNSSLWAITQSRQQGGSTSWRLCFKVYTLERKALIRLDHSFISLSPSVCVCACWGANMRKSRPLASHRFTPHTTEGLDGKKKQHFPPILHQIVLHHVYIILYITLMRIYLTL